MVETESNEDGKATKFPNEPDKCPRCGGPLVDAGVYGLQKVRGRKYKCRNDSCSHKMTKRSYDVLRAESLPTCNVCGDEIFANEPANANVTCSGCPVPAERGDV